MLIVLFCLDGVTEVARPRPYRRGLRSHLIKDNPSLGRKTNAELNFVSLTDKWKVQIQRTSPSPRDATVQVQRNNSASVMLS